MAGRIMGREHGGRRTGKVYRQKKRGRKMGGGSTLSRRMREGRIIGAES
jgi:hypothetical protein